MELHISCELMKDVFRRFLIVCWAGVLIMLLDAGWDKLSGSHRFFNIGSFYWIVALPTWIAQFVFLGILNLVKLFKQAPVGKNS